MVDMTSPYVAFHYVPLVKSNPDLESEYLGSRTISSIAYLW